MIYYDILCIVLTFFVIAAEKYGKDLKNYKSSKERPVLKEMGCKTFGKHARFSAHSVINTDWFVFYYFGPQMPFRSYRLRVPSRREISYLHFLMDDHVDKDFSWSATMLLMFEYVKNETVLFVERTNTGRYWMYLPELGLKADEMTKRSDVQLKQTSDNKYIGLMFCKDQVVYIMSRLKEVPPKAMLQEEASKLGYVGRQGRSYLYQGSDWMPTGESEEGDVWTEGWEPTQRANNIK